MGGGWGRDGLGPGERVREKRERKRMSGVTGRGGIQSFKPRNDVAGPGPGSERLGPPGGKRLRLGEVGKWGSAGRS